MARWLQTSTRKEHIMTELNAQKRNALRKNQFAYVDSKGGEHLPIHDAAHVRNALSRFNQTNFDSEAAKTRAKKKLLTAAKRHGIEVGEDDAVNQH
jgi:hypothetical protein